VVSLPYLPPATGFITVAVGLLSGALYLMHARHARNPLLALELFRNQVFRSSVLGGSLFRIGIGAVPFLLPLMFQIGFGDSAVESGMITFASSAGALVMKPATQRALRMFGFRDTLVWNGLLSAVMIGLCAAFRPTWPAAAIYGALLIGGFFRSLQFTAYNTLAYGDVPRARMSSATSLYITCQQLAATIGISAGAVSLEISMAFAGHETPQPMDFSHAFLVVALFTLIAAPIALLMPRDAGDELTGRRSVPVEPVRRPAE